MPDEPQELPLTPAWCEANGFSRDQFFGYVRELSEGPGDTTLLIAVGNYPTNALCCSVVVGGYGIVANVKGTADILTLIRLLDGAHLDHPYEAWINDAS